jgi:hypothetical protein
LTSRIQKSTEGEIMKSFVALIRGFTVAAITTIAGGTSAMAATFVYVSNAEDGDISAYRMLDSGE